MNGNAVRGLRFNDEICNIRLLAGNERDMGKS